MTKTSIIQFLESVGIEEVEKVLCSVEKVAVESTLISAGGVRQGSSAQKFVIVLGDYHKNINDLLEVVAHEVLHIVLNNRFPSADHVLYEQKICEASQRIVESYGRQLLVILHRYMSADKIRQMTA
ncbi:MAG: hypothetical protein Q8P52_02310 [bacterium]|nr:hypothetical protein [bacterium]